MSAVPVLEKAGRRVAPKSNRRVTLKRPAAGHVLMIVAGALAFLLTYAALADKTERAELATARLDIPAGMPLTVGLFAPYSFAPGDDGLPPGMLTLDQVEEAAAEGRHLAEAVAAGVLLRSSDLAAASAPRPRAMSFSVDASRAVGGSLVAGDLVDVIAVDQTGARFVLTAAPVVAVGAGSSGAGRAITISVEVDAAASLRLAHSLGGGVP